MFYHGLGLPVPKQCVLPVFRRSSRKAVGAGETVVLVRKHCVLLAFVSETRKNSVFFGGLVVRWHGAKQKTRKRLSVLKRFRIFFDG